MTTSSDPDEIRAEIERTRANLSGDVDALADTANPKNVARRQVDNTKAKVSDALSGVKEKVMGAADDVKDKVSGSGGDASSAAQARLSAAGDTVANAPGAAKEKTRGNPLAAGLIAFGAGMLISGLIPASQKEQDAVSGLQDNLEPLKAKATEAAKEMGDSLKGQAQEAVESVKATATEGVDNVKAEGQSAKDDVQDQAQQSKDRVQQHSS